VSEMVDVFRVKPGQELLGELIRYCSQNHITSGLILGIIGSVESAKLNFLTALPGRYESVEYAGPLEIVCAQGSVALKESDVIVHVHIQLSRQDGSVGGHLVEARVFSTAEVAIQRLDGQLRRVLDGQTGLNELDA